MKYSKYHIELHYSVVQNELNIFRTDSFFVTPTYEVDSEWQKDEQKRLVKYLSRFMRRPKSDGDIYIEEIKPDGIDCNGFERFKYEKLKWLHIKNGAVVIKSWWKEREKYFDGDAMSPDRAIAEFLQIVEMY